MAHSAGTPQVTVAAQVATASDRVATPHWLLRARVAIPAAPKRYCDRPELARRCCPVESAATVLMAPAGFGKTTMLAAACRRVASTGVPVAWLTLAGDDPATLDTYLAYAFRQAGFDTPAYATASPVDASHPRTVALLHAIDALGVVCVLALDELECVTDPESVALLNHVLHYAPPTLHLALAYRHLPPGLDAVEPLLARGAMLLTARDLRFSTPDIARFFDLALSSRELAQVATRSTGWPIALQMLRNAPGEHSVSEEPVARDAVGSWIAGRFWRGFETRDRELVLDLAIFDWLDADLVEEVLEEADALTRAIALPGLNGLLSPAGGRTPDVYRLHPLLRERFAAERRHTNPARWRDVRQRLAAALARRGAVVEAMRHAAEAGNPRLAGQILLRAGGLQWWLREGADRLIAANRYLTDEAVAACPRLAMARSLALLYEGRGPEARGAFARASRAVAEDPGGAMDRMIAHAVLMLTGSRPFDAAEVAALTDDARRVVAFPETPRVVRGAMLFGLAASRARRGEFESAVPLAVEARQLVAGRSTYLTLWSDSVLGQSAMARGNVREALEHYRDARRIARERFLEDPRMSVLIDLHAHELAVERNHLLDHPDPARMVRDAYRVGACFTHYTVAACLATDLALEHCGVDAALSLLGDLAEHAHDAGQASLLRLIAALRVSVLVDAGEVGTAEREWRTGALPSTPEDCLDFDTHSWRSVEALACARTRLLAGLGDTTGAAALEQALAETASARGLRRTLFRSLALRVRLRHDANDPDASRDAATEYLRLFLTTDYARPLLRAGDAAKAALKRVVDAAPDGPYASAARRLLAMVCFRSAASAPPLTAREMEVLGLLETRKDKEIALALGLSTDGVRYHLRNIFSKLSVGRRQDVICRARALGFLSDPVESAD